MSLTESLQSCKGVLCLIIPAWQENIKKYDTKITAISERIMKYCPEQNIRQESKYMTHMSV